MPRAAAAAAADNAPRCDVAVIQGSAHNLSRSLSLAHPFNN